MCQVVLKDSKRHLGTINVVKGTNLLDLLAQNDVYVPANCGGKGVCNKCKVTIYANEKYEVVKSCAYSIEQDITVYIPYEDNKSIVLEPIGQAGIAFDIGTTSIATYYVDIKKEASTSFNRLNRQAAFGADVLSRIKACEQGKLADLQKSLISQLNEILSFIPTSNYLPVMVAANTTMLHILAGKDPTAMGVYPFTPTFTDAQFFQGKDLGLNCASLTLLPSAAAYFGADAVAGLASLGLEKKSGINIFVDIGTNAEMAIVDNGRITACAAAAGPAFEGANIEKGMGGVEGAIDHVFIRDGMLSYSVIGGAKPIGICGSGLVDAVALMLEHNVIDYYGTFTNLENNISANLKNGKFYLSEEVYISQADIREFQLAKSAVYTGIITLLDAHSALLTDVDGIYIAGGLGYHIDKPAASKCGIIPHQLEDTSVSVGNTSGKGAVNCLLDEDFLCYCRILAKRIKVIDLAESKHFMERFVDNMNFEC